MPSNTKILILAGGLGTRLRPLTHTQPKVLIPVLGRPFLEYVLKDFLQQGFMRFVLAVGFFAEQVEAQMGNGQRFGCEIEYARETQPLGTGGAVFQALPLLGKTFMVVNGDTLLQVDLTALLHHHWHEGQNLTMVTPWVPDRDRYGAVVIESGRVVRFDEKKTHAGAGFINGGLYVINREFFRGAPAGAFSIEQDLMPIHLGQISAFETQGFFVDMGTHEALETLSESLSLYLAAGRSDSG